MNAFTILTVLYNTFINIQITNKTFTPLILLLLFYCFEQNIVDFLYKTRFGYLTVRYQSVRF